MRRALLALLLVPAARAAAPVYAGNEACAQCHRTEAAQYHQAAMAQALQPVATCDILKAHPNLVFQEGAYRSQIVRAEKQSVLTVTDGSAKLTVPLQYAFGLGSAGQTYVFEYNGALHESRLSFFNEPGSLDLTMGAQSTKPASLEEAAGRRMSATDVKDCFGCHTTGADRTQGVGCESCHGPSAAHVAAIHGGGQGAGAAMAKLSTLSAENTSELCGTCHRTWSQIALSGPRGVNNVRFQPYRLTNSKCYDTADARIRCTACHDPHGNPVREAAFYDAKCGACHSAAAHMRVCKVAKSNCVTCHMPKIDLPGAHHKFTDHEIRIARAGDPYPN